MKCATLLFGLILLVLPHQAAARQTQVDTLHEAAQAAASQMTVLYSQFQNRLALADSVRRTAEEDLSRFGSLEARLDSIASKQRQRELAEKATRAAKYDAGRQALTDMSRGVTLISFMEGLVGAEQSLMSVTNIWRDSTFRNAYDRVEDWGTIAGGLIGSLALFEGSGDVPRPAVAIGSGAAMLVVSKLVGTLWGQEQGSKTFTKMQHIEVSRRAYDDLQIRAGTLQQYIKENEDLQTRIAVATGNYSAQVDSAAAAAEVLGLLNEFDRVLNQIPLFIQSIRSASDVYARMYGLGFRTNPLEACKTVGIHPTGLGPSLCGVIEETSRLDAKYHKDVLPILKVSAQITKILAS